MTIFEIVIVWTMLIGLPLLFVWSIVRRLRKHHRDSARIKAQWAVSSDEPPLIEQHVRIMDKRCYTESIGIKTPVCREVYIITVKTDDGKQAEHTVDKDIYLTIPSDAVGTLAIVGDRVYGFCED